MLTNLRLMNSMRGDLQKGRETEFQRNLHEGNFRLTTVPFKPLTVY